VGAQPVAVVDEVMARQAFPGQNPIGKQLWIGLGMDPLTVVGVAGHVRYWGPAGDDGAKVRAQLYYPFAQVPDTLQRRWSQLMSIAVRTKVDPHRVEQSLRRALRGASGDQALYEMQTMEQIDAATLAQQRFLSLLFGIFAGLALALACVGIYGVLAYLTRQRIPEIGLRMALGATAYEVTGLVLRQSLGMIVGGVAVGIAGSVLAGDALRKAVAGVQSGQAGTTALMIAVLAAAAMAASFVPARRASRVDPVKALREE
jgi:ABC-type lipoprotein release transport system permease subunit